MAITHVTSVRDAITDAVVDLIDGGTTDAQGDVVFMTSGDVTVATLNMSNAAFGASASGTATAAAISDDTNAVGGTIAKFKIQDRDNVEILRGSVTATSGGGDIELSSVAIDASDTVSLTSLTYTAPT